MQSEIIADKMKELRFLGMHRAFESTFETGKNQNFTMDEMINYLLDAEFDDRKSRKIDRSISLAKFRYRASVEDLIYDEGVQVDETRLPNAFFHGLIAIPYCAKANPADPLRPLANPIAQEQPTMLQSMG